MSAERVGKVWRNGEGSGEPAEAEGNTGLTNGKYGELPAAAVERDPVRVTAIYASVSDNGVRAGDRDRGVDRKGRVHLQVTEKGKAEFTAKAAAAGVALSQYLRRAALQIGVMHRYDQAAVHQFRKLG